MERRRESRLVEPQQEATIHLLGSTPGPVIHATTLDVSGSGMRLRSNLPVPCGAAIEITVNRTVARGSVFRCEPDQDAYELGVHVSMLDIVTTGPSK